MIDVLVGLMCALLPAPGTASAQDQRRPIIVAQAFSHLGGGVFYRDGSPARDARVVVRDAATQVVRETASSSWGGFEFNTLPPGTYDLQVSMPGFVSLQHRVTLTLRGRVVARFTIVPPGAAMSGRPARGRPRRVVEWRAGSSVESEILRSGAGFALSDVIPVGPGTSLAVFEPVSEDVVSYAVIRMDGPLTPADLLDRLAAAERKLIGVHTMREGVHQLILK